jgi:hypothetical protein
MKKFLTKSAIAAGVVLSAAIASRPAMASSLFQVTIEDPNTQQSTLYTNPNAYGATGVYEETFDSQKTGYNQNGMAFDGNSNIGTYNQTDIVGANLYGGAGGTGNYITVQPGKDGTPSGYQTTLTLANPERYFGIDWTAGDAYNELDFYSGNTLLQKFTTADVINYLKAQPSGETPYQGNPNNRSLDTSEPFAFLNFFADPNNSNVTFNKVVFINNSSGTGFESDNHTIAASYTSTSGKTIISSTPEPSVAMGLGIIAGIGMLLQNRRLLKKA